MRAGLPTAAAALLVALLTPAGAQEATFQPGQFTIESLPAYCGDIQTVVRSDGPLITAPDTYRIILNGPAFDALPPTIRLFVYFQTCGMIFYGNDTFLADSFAARRGVRDRWLSAVDIEAICETPTLSNLGWESSPDGPRCAAIYEVMREELTR